MSPTRKIAKKPAKKAAAKKSAKKPTKKQVAKKQVAKKQPVAKRAVAKKVVAKKVVAKKAAVKKAAPKKPAPAKKAAPARKAAPAKQAVPAKKAQKYQAKTRPTGASVDEHIGAITDPGRRQDCRTLVEVFSKATGKQPKMWGPSIVAFGKYHYKYESGHEGDSCLAGFASRKGAITLYLSLDPVERGEFMRRIGKHREGVGCVYIRDLEGVDLEVLGEMVKRSAEYIRLKHPNEVD
jgi:hypothetical protein